MTKDEMRIEIGKACGWKPGKWSVVTLCTGEAMIADGWVNPETDECDPELPDYLNDLNAMAEARRTLTEKEQAVFADAIAWTTGNSYDPYYDGWGGLTLLDVFAMIDAPAEMQAMAFLKAKGLWKE